MNTMFWVVSWGFAGWLIGILAYFGGGFLVIPRLDDKRTNKLANHYSKIAMKILGRGALVERGTKYDLYRTSHDGEKNADTFKAGGETAHVTNDTGLLATMHKKPLGLVPPPEEDVGVYVSPELGELGEIETTRKEKDEHVDDGEYVDDVTLSGDRPFATLRGYARRMVPESRSLWDLDETVDLYKQSQSLFGSSTTTQFMILIVAYSAAMLVTWVILTQAGGAAPGGGGGISVPGMGG